MIGCPAALACFVLCACCDSQQPTWPHAVQTRRLKFELHSWHRSASGSWTVPSKCGQLARSAIVRWIIGAPVGAPQEPRRNALDSRSPVFGSLEIGRSIGG